MSFGGDVRELWSFGGFRRLATARLLSQVGDGMFQVGIATAFFFDPTNGGTKWAIAAGFAVLLAPFTIVGPFVGPLIDRWQRQRIVLVSNIVRLVMSVLLLAVLTIDSPSWILYVLALFTISINRFMMAAMTAGMPQVVPASNLLMANSILPTLGTVATSVGAGIGAVITFIVPNASDTSLALAALTASALCFAASSYAATRISHHELGPDRVDDSKPLGDQVRVLASELKEGVAYLHERVTPFWALTVMAIQRFLYGLMFLAAVLISRTVLADPNDTEAGLGNFSIVLAFAAIGFGLAAVVTPLLGERFSRQRWIVLCLIVGAGAQLLLTAGSDKWLLYAAAIVVSFSVQGAKIAVDTIVQRDTADHMRGRAFTLYDMAFNIAFIIAALVGAAVLPDNGYSPAVMGVVAAAYLVVAWWYSRTPIEAEESTPVSERSTTS